MEVMTPELDSSCSKFFVDSAFQEYSQRGQNCEYLGTGGDGIVTMKRFLVSPGTPLVSPCE